MTTADLNPDLLQNGTVEGAGGQNIGKVGQVYLDNETGRPNWVTVKTGWFGTSESFVPLDAATVDGDTIRVPYDKDMIKGAPHNEVGVPLSESDERELYRYYSLGDGDSYYTGTDTGTVGTGTVDTDVERATGTTGTRTGTGGEYLTRSEEQLHVGTEKVQTGRARLRKYVVTENQTVTVPVSHEEVRLVREPVQPGDTTGESTIGEDSADVTLTEERVVVNKETVPVEKVRLDTETVTEQQEVTEAVRKEQVELDGDSDTIGGNDVGRVPPTR